MSDVFAFEVTKEQRDVLLQGLRYVRSSIMLNVEDPTPEYVAERTSRLQDVAELTNLLNGLRVAEPVGAGR